MSNYVMGSAELERMAFDADDLGKSVLVVRSEVDDELIEWIEIDGEEYFNDCIQEELDTGRSDAQDAFRNYYG